MKSEITILSKMNENKMNENNIDQIDINHLFENLKIKTSDTAINGVVEQMKNSGSLEEKCILAREFINPQSTIMEQIIKRDLEIGKKTNETSGDGSKDGKNYEIKFSGHDKDSKFNWVQIRPHHNVDYYILIGYNLYEGPMGTAYNFKIPAEDLYQLIIDYGGYAHGTNKELGAITKDNFAKGGNVEYALRINPNHLGKKSTKLWGKLKNYITPYHKDHY